MFEYREEYITDKNWVEAANFYSKEGWDIFQVEKKFVAINSAYNPHNEIHRTLYMRRLIQK